MEPVSLYSSLPPILPVPKKVTNPNRHYFPSDSRSPLRSPSKTFTAKNCRETTGDNTPSPLTSSSAYAVLGVDPSCSAAELKAAFRSKVEQSSLNYNWFNLIYSKNYYFLILFFTYRLLLLVRRWNNTIQMWIEMGKILIRWFDL